MRAYGVGAKGGLHGGYVIGGVRAGRGLSASAAYESSSSRERGAPRGEGQRAASAASQARMTFAATVRR